MAYKPELLTTAASLEEIERLITAGADAFVIGESRYGMRLAGEFDLDKVKSAVQLAKQHQARIYVSVNNIIDNAILEYLPDYLASLQSIGVDAIVFGDPAVLKAARSFAPKLALHWNTEMTSTNYATANYWGSKGATRFVLARELNMEQIVEIKSNTSLEVQAQVHGMTNIYHSKRYLLNSYMVHHNEKMQRPETATSHDFYLTEDERPGERFPIFEDANGTHIMSSDDVCMLENLHELMEIGVESLKVEGIMKPEDYNEKVIRAYRQAIDAYLSDPEHYEFQEHWLDEIREAQDSNRELSFGFYYKEQVY